MRKIIKEAKFGMLVTRSADGQLHSRAMAPASHKGLVFQFIANTDCACPLPLPVFTGSIKFV